MPTNITACPIDDYKKAEGIAVLSVVVISFALSCSLIIYTVVTAFKVANRESMYADEEVIVNDPGLDNLFLLKLLQKARSFYNFFVLFFDSVSIKIGCKNDSQNGRVLTEAILDKAHT